MKGRILDFDYYNNRAVIGFETSFADTYDKYYGKDVNIEIKLWRTKRSLAANRYMWVLVDKIAAETRQIKDDVYKEAIKEIGGVSDVFLMIDEAVERFCESWSAQGLGWQTEIAGSRDGKTNVIAYYGSSTFTTDQMTQLIENLIFEAEQLGIDVDTPDKQAWWEAVQQEAREREQANRKSV